MHSILIHITNEEPILAEVEELPSTTDQAVYCINPRRRDGKELHYVESEVQSIILPWHRINLKLCHQVRKKRLLARSLIRA